jgi:hypothetical protein
VTRVLVVNDYSLVDSWRDVKEGRSPSHFLYGVDHLEREGFDVTIISEEWSRWLAGVDRRMDRLRFPFGSIGSLDRQLAAARFLNDVDAIYAPCQTQIQALTYLRALGVIRVPIVVLGHHPLVRGRLGSLRRPLVRLMLRGLSALPTLSRAVADEANELARRSVATALRWGPEASFYPSPIYPGSGVFAAGRTGRDFTTFGRAATLAAAPATILTLKSSATPDFQSFGPNIKVMVPDRFMDYSETAHMFASARALAIPMARQVGLCGLTSLMDALGAGKAVIMTRNALIDLDIEKLGIGRWVEPGDVQGWADALRFFEDNPDAAVEMGSRARALVDNGLDYRSFSDEIVRLVREGIGDAR